MSIPPKNLYTIYPPISHSEISKNPSTKAPQITQNYPSSSKYAEKDFPLYSSDRKESLNREW